MLETTHFTSYCLKRRALHKYYKLLSSPAGWNELKMWLVHKQPKWQFRVFTTPNSSKVCRLHYPCFSPRLTFVSVNCPLQKSLYSTQREGSKICQTDPVVISCIWLLITCNDLWSHPVTKDSYGSQSWIEGMTGRVGQAYFCHLFQSFYAGKQSFIWSLP